MVTKRKQKTRGSGKSELLRTILEEYLSKTLEAIQAMKAKLELKIDRLSKELHEEIHQLTGEVKQIKTRMDFFGSINQRKPSI